MRKKTLKYLNLLVFFSMTLFATPTLANDPPKADEHGGKFAKAVDQKLNGKSKGAKKEDPHAAPEVKSKMEHTDGYVNEWIPFPPFNAIALPGLEKFSYKPVRGEMTVVIMLATWCAPCVRMMPEILRLQARTARLPVKYLNIFTNDTKQDAIGFMTEHGMKSGVLATHEVLATFKNPELPAIYVGDRNSWMLMRYLKATPENLAEIEESIKYLTAI